MKKYLQNFWARLLACILCTVMVLGAIMSGVLAAVYASIGTKSEAYKSGQHLVAQNYAAYIYEAAYEDNLDTLAEELTGKNFTYSVEYVKNSNGTGQPETTLLYSNRPAEAKGDYIFEIQDGAYVDYNLSSVWEAIRLRDIVGNNVHYEIESTVIGYKLDLNTGLFYFKTDAGYFIADKVWINNEEIGTYCYELIESEDAFYYYSEEVESSYGLSGTLDVSQYGEWNWIDFEYGARPLTYGEGNDTFQLTTEGEFSNAVIYSYDTYYEIQTYDKYTAIAFLDEGFQDVYCVSITLNKDLAEEDLFAEWQALFEDIHRVSRQASTYLTIFVILFIFSFALLIYSANGDKEKLGVTYKLPVGILTIVVISVETILGLLLWEVVGEFFIGYQILPLDMSITIFAIVIGVMLFLGFVWLLNIVTRFKTRTFIRYSELYYAYHIIKCCWKKLTTPFKEIIKMIRDNISLFWKTVIILGVVAFVEALGISIFRHYPDLLFAFFAIGKGIEIPLILFVLVQMQKLQEGSKRIASGDLSKPIDTSKMFWEFKKHGENINKVSEGIAIAVEDQLKSERFKTELITNVSHDIKTPLTSIVNYVDLLKKEDLGNATADEYVEVLDRQSARLKKLIEDLMEASKASTGNLAVQFAECDVDVLLTQVIGEFEDKLVANNLEVVVEKPEHSVMVIADGRHMWRVLDNLLNNACKYSQPNTRVYVSLKQEGQIATLVFKNISKSALNIPSEELLERFVRGDSSRNTEGSGLGLSIAQSLTELMNGTMKLDIDGDLFKVTLKFNAMLPKDVEQ